MTKDQIKAQNLYSNAIWNDMEELLAQAQAAATNVLGEGIAKIHEKARKTLDSDPKTKSFFAGFNVEFILQPKVRIDYLVVLKGRRK